MCSGTKTISLHHNMEIYRRNNKDVVYLFCSLNFSAILRKKKHLDIFSIYSIRKSILCQSLSVRFFLMVKAWKKSAISRISPQKNAAVFCEMLDKHGKRAYNKLKMYHMIHFERVLMVRIIKKQEKLNQKLRETFLFRDGAEDCADDAVKSEKSEFALFEVGEAIYSVEKYRHAVAFLFSGEAAAYRPYAGGNRVALNYFSDGAMFGMAAVFVKSERYVTEVVAQKACRVLFLPQELLSALFAKNLLVAERYIAFLSGRIEYLNRRIAEFTAGEAENRLALYLCKLAETQGGSLTLSCSITALCEMLDVGRASLYRAFDGLTECGAIERSGKTVCVRSMEKLRTACLRGAHENSADA
jgi:CRP-like cAMP-binding protein